jgi:hypothetical protein
MSYFQTALFGLGRIGMKVAATLISIWFIFIIIGTGCSNEEPASDPGKNAVVRQPIEVPGEKAETLTVDLSATPEPAVKTESKTMVQAVAEKGKEKKADGIKEDEKGYYVTQKGDSISSIAERKDVYGDRLKWPIVYRLNMKELDDMAKDENFPNTEVPAGIKLKIVSSLQAQENLTKNPKDYWVINVVSSMEEKNIVPHAITLIRNDYSVYITRADIKGKEWMRLRIGFFGQKEEADEVGKKLMEMLGISDIWTTKAGDIERGEFGGY